MEIVYDDEGLVRAMAELAGFGSLGKEGGLSAERPVLVDRFLEEATEVDVDAIRDHTGETLIGAVMEHIEEAGVHSGDSSCSLPPYSLSPAIQQVLREQVARLARELKVVGLMNTQFAIQDDNVFILEVNPRASRTVPFVSKATGVPLAKVAARCMVGRTLAEQGMETEIIPGYFSVKEAIFPFAKFQNVDPILGPEMRSTGEVMGVGRSFGEAFARAQEAAHIGRPPQGRAFVSVRDPDKQRLLPVARELLRRGFTLGELMVTVAAVQATPVFLDREATAARLHSIGETVEPRARCCPGSTDPVVGAEMVVARATEAVAALVRQLPGSALRRLETTLRWTHATPPSGSQILRHSEKSGRSWKKPLNWSKKCCRPAMKPRRRRPVKP